MLLAVIPALVVGTAATAATTTQSMPAATWPLGPRTCIYQGTTRLLCHRPQYGPNGLLFWDTANNECNASVSGSKRRGWLWADESDSHVASVRRRAPGRWRVVGTDNNLTPEGSATLSNGSWQIRNARGRLVARATGPDGFAPAAVLLVWGSKCL
jgi:hypothetical protein